jgi:hypothetical protein
MMPVGMEAVSARDVALRLARGVADREQRPPSEMDFGRLLGGKRVQ